MDTADSDIEQLQARYQHHPNSPLFARLAEFHLERGRVHDALDLCAEGVLLYPEYAAGHLMRGRCYEALGRISEARTSYHRALELSPFNTVVQHLLVALPDLPEAERIDAIFARPEAPAAVPETDAPERHEEVFSIEPAPERTEEAASVDDEEPPYDPFPTFEEYLRLHPAPSEPRMTLDEYLSGRTPFPADRKDEIVPAPKESASDLESLAKMLQEASRIVPKEETQTSPVPPASNDESESAGAGQPTIVTQTMAEIYVAQNEFKAAIDAYKELMKKQPEHAKAFQQRIDAIGLLMGNVP